MSVHGYFVDGNGTIYAHTCQNQLNLTQGDCHHYWNVQLADGMMIPGSYSSFEVGLDRRDLHGQGHAQSPQVLPNAFTFENQHVCSFRTHCLARKIAFSLACTVFY
jgi:hypothetical protein